VSSPGDAAAALIQAQQQSSPGGSQDAGSAVQNCPLPLQWIEIELVGEDGKGVPGQAYLIGAPDGKEYSGRTDARGWARVDGIPGGTCKVSFIELDQEAWESA
jgi:hypothetical protein